MTIDASALALGSDASATKERLIKMTLAAELADRLSELLRLAHPPVAISFLEATPSADAETIVIQPAGCCYWALAQKGRLDTKPSDHGNCSVGSYTHGLIDLETAAAGDDTSVLLSSGWVGEADLANAPHLPVRPQTIRYEPLAESDQPDVVLLHLSPTALMTLQGACPKIRLVTKPQCQIVPLAYAGEMVVSPGCAVSRVRTNLPAGELTCAVHTSDLPGIVGRLERAVAADNVVAEYAAANDRLFFGEASASCSSPP
jgi:uncharacterized protein (DUF169 family)